MHNRQPAICQKYFSQRYPTCVPIPKGKTVYDRDCRITADYPASLITGAVQNLSFSFSSMTAHGYEVPKDKLYRFQPPLGVRRLYEIRNNDIDPTPFLNLYHNCVAEADSHWWDASSKLLRKRKLLNPLVLSLLETMDKNSMRIIKLLSTHGSNYSPVQTHIPFLLYEPGEQPQTYHHRALHAL